MGKSASCSKHGGFQGLLPIDYTPPTTAPPTTLPPPAINAVCSEGELQQHSGTLVCAATGYGPLWIDAPFVQDNDVVALLPTNASPDLSLQVGDIGLLMDGFQEVQSYGQHYWCVSAGIKNFADEEGSFNLFEFSLLTPSGSLLNATFPLITNQEALLSSGGLSPNGTAVGLVCFDQPLRTTGRFAVVYDPILAFDGDRALYYFDH